MALNISCLQIEQFFLRHWKMLRWSQKRRCSARRFDVQRHHQLASKMMMTLSVETSCQTSSFLWSTKHPPVSHCISIITMRVISKRSFESLSLSLFFFFFRKDSQKWEGNRIYQKFLASFWKQGMSFCAKFGGFSSCPFLKSILEKKRRT